MQQAKEVLKKELSYFQDFFAKSLHSEIPLINSIMEYILKHSGKQMRPLFALLCARIGGEMNERAYRAALLVEMLHIASLVHDDIVDESMERRGAYSVNALWGNKTAVFAGDHLSLNALLISLGNKDYDILQIYMDAIRQMIDGELLQLDKARKLNLDENIYYKIIKSKTASFFAAACAAGATATYCNKEEVNKLHLFGEKVGIAFQLKDDLFGYSSANVGKPQDNDIHEKKLTLPVIYTINNASPRLKRRLKHIIKRKNKSKDKVAYVVDQVIKSGGVKYAEKQMLAYRDEALALLHTFTKNEVRDALESLVRYTTDRTY